MLPRPLLDASLTLTSSPFNSAYYIIFFGIYTPQTVDGECIWQCHASPMLCYLTSTPHQSFSWPIIYQTHMKISRNSFFFVFSWAIAATHTFSYGNMQQTAGIIYYFLKGSLTHHNHAQCDLPNLPFKKVLFKTIFFFTFCTPWHVDNERVKWKVNDDMRGGVCTRVLLKIYDFATFSKVR